MKLRILENNITLRLQNEEVQMLKEKNILKQSTSLPDLQLDIEIEVKSTSDIEFQFKDNVFSFTMPQDYLEQFDDNHRIGFSGLAGNIEIIIEKDLPSRRRSKN